MPLPAAVKSLLRFVIHGTKAADGASRPPHLARRHRIDGRVWLRRRTAARRRGAVRQVARASVISFQEPVGVQRLRPEDARAGGAAPVRGEALVHPRGPASAWEAKRSSYWSCSTRPQGGWGIHGGFPPRLHRRRPAAARLGGGSRRGPLRQAVAERQTHRAALRRGRKPRWRPPRTSSEVISPAAPDAAPPPRRDGESEGGARRGRERQSPTPDTTLRLVEAVRRWREARPRRGSPLCAGGERPPEAARRDHRYDLRISTTKAQGVTKTHKEDKRQKTNHRAQAEKAKSMQRFQEALFSVLLAFSVSLCLCGWNSPSCVL